MNILQISMENHFTITAVGRREQVQALEHMRDLLQPQDANAGWQGGTRFGKSKY